MSSLDSLKHLKILLDDIKLATNNFSTENIIGHGGFGNVYKGELSRPEGRITVAVKRLVRNSKIGQGQHQFLMEITMLSRYQDENLVKLLGFCDEKGEMILVYEYMSNGSLDRHLSRIGLTWYQRLKICCGAANGLLYLHKLDGGLQRVLHRDIKSSNILLDQKGEAKISDLGLSKLAPANQKFTFLVTAPAGTYGYWDPQYIETGILTKESDVYSFGVVLFEVLCGRLACENYNDGRPFLARLATQSYEENKMDDIIDDNIKEQMDPNSLAKFAAVAYKCLRKRQDERPTMAEVVKELEGALDFQEKRVAQVDHMEGYNNCLLDLQSDLSMFKKHRLRVIAQLDVEDQDIIGSIDFDRDDEFFATAGRAGYIKVFNFSKIVNESQVEYHPIVDFQTSSSLNCLSWNKVTKNHIASCGYEKTVTIWDWNKAQSVMEYQEHEDVVYTVDFSATQPSMLVSGGDDRKVKVWSSNQEKSVININMEAYVRSVKYHPGSSHIVVGTKDDRCHYYDLRNTCSPLNIFTGHKGAASYVRFLSDEVLVFASTDNTLRLWDIKRNTHVGTYTGHTNKEIFVGLSVNGDFMACGSETNEVFVYHKAFSKPMITYHVVRSSFAGDNSEDRPSDSIYDVYWKRDGSAIVASSSNGVIQVLAFEDNI